MLSQRRHLKVDVILLTAIPACLALYVMFSILLIPLEALHDWRLGLSVCLVRWIASLLANESNSVDVVKADLFLSGDDKQVSSAFGCAQAATERRRN